MFELWILLLPTLESFLKNFSPNFIQVQFSAFSPHPSLTPGPPHLPPISTPHHCPFFWMGPADLRPGWRLGRGCTFRPSHRWSQNVHHERRDAWVFENKLILVNSISRCQSSIISINDTADWSLPFYYYSFCCTWVLALYSPSPASFELFESLNEPLSMFYVVKEFFDCLLWNECDVNLFQ